MAIKSIIGVMALGMTMQLAHAALPMPQLPPAIPAPPVAAEFKTYGQGLPMAEFLRTTIGDILRRPYVLTPAIAGDTAPISADLSRVKASDLLLILQQVLDAAGYVLKDVRGVFVLDKKPPADQHQAAVDNSDVLIYTPKYRSVSSLASYFVLFPKLQFAYGAGIARSTATPALAGSTTSPSSNGTPTATLGSDFSSGATTFSQTSGDPTLLVVRGDPDRLQAFKVFMEKVDVVVPEVIVRAYVLEIRDEKSNQSGVSMAMDILHHHAQLQLGGIPPTGGDSVKLSLGSASVSAVIGALAGDSHVHLLSSPVLRAADGSSASASIGTETPTLGSVTTSNGAATQSIQYQSAGVLLTIAPRVFQESIRLKVSQEVSSFVQTDTGLTNTPTKLSRSFISDVVARSGDLVLLGGLHDSKTSTTKSHGLFGFGTGATDQQNSEIVVLLAIERTADTPAGAGGRTDVSARPPAP